ncbi:MAG TPA: four helix bundle protein [Saprospiraceae bacterium]|nr:four helix bundle protein [Saprospiraceae bacterium]
MARFRFQNLEIWQEAVQLALIFFDLADELEQKKLFRFADQCRGVSMGMTNNIAESTGSNMIGEQTQLLRYSKRECFEAANILIVLELKSLVRSDFRENVFNRLDILSRRIQKYSDSLVQKEKSKTSKG